MTCLDIIRLKLMTNQSNRLHFDIYFIVYFLFFFRLDVVSQVGRWPCPRLVLAPAGGSISRSADGVYHAICITQGSSSSSRLFFLFLYRKTTRSRRSCCTSGERPRAALSSSSSSSSLSRQLHQHIQQQRRSEFKKNKIKF
jgi:hypothetical protein